MQINWKVRVRNRAFWLTLIPAMVLLAQAGAALFGVTLELEALSGRLLEVINALFGVLAVLGVVNDPTTAGVSDSVRALGYASPYKEGK